MFRRIPAGGQWQSHGKRCTGKAQKYPKQQSLLIRLYAVQPRRQQGRQHDHLANQARFFRFKLINEYAHDNT